MKQIKQKFFGRWESDFENTFFYRKSPVATADFSVKLLNKRWIYRRKMGCLFEASKKKTTKLLHRHIFHCLILGKVYWLDVSFSCSRGSRWQIFLKIGVLKNFENFTRETPVLEFIFDKIAGLKACNCKKKLQYRGFPLKFAIFQRSTFTEHLRWLLLVIQVPLLITLDQLFIWRSLWTLSAT